MHVTLVEINVHEDKVDEFIEVFRQNHRALYRKKAICASMSYRAGSEFALLYLRSL